MRWLMSRFKYCESPPVAGLGHLTNRAHAVLPERPEPMVVVEEDEQPFLQDARNLDLISMILQGLLDSTEDTEFTMVTSANTMVPPPQFGPVEKDARVVTCTHSPQAVASREGATESKPLCDVCEHHHHQGERCAECGHVGVYDPVRDGEYAVGVVHTWSAWLSQHATGARRGGIFLGHNNNQCVQRLVQALSGVCSLWDGIVVAEVHGGAKEVIAPRALRTLKYKARTLDIDKACAKAFLKGVKKRFGHIKMVSCWMD